MIKHSFPQYSPEWWDLRQGIPTASSASKILTPGGKLSAQSRTYINELVADALDLGDPPMEPTEWMLRGTELEPEARRFFEFETGWEIEQVGSITNDDGSALCSPDGLVRDHEGWECKCPKPATQIGYLQGDGIPSYYKPQVHMSMAITDIEQWHFLSYHPNLPPYRATAEWDDYTALVADALEEFLIRLDLVRRELGLADLRA